MNRWSNRIRTMKTITQNARKRTDNYGYFRKLLFQLVGSFHSHDKPPPPPQTFLNRPRIDRRCNIYRSTKELNPQQLESTSILSISSIDSTKPDYHGTISNVRSISPWDQTVSENEKHTSGTPGFGSRELLEGIGRSILNDPTYNAFQYFLYKSDIGIPGLFPESRRTDTSEIFTQNDHFHHKRC